MCVDVRYLRRGGQTLSPDDRVDPGLASVRGLVWLGPNHRREGFVMSIKLTDMQLVILSAAAQRKDRCLVAPLTLKGGPLHRVANKMISSGLAKEIKAKTGDPVWRRDEASGASYALKLTTAGTKAIVAHEGAAGENHNQPVVRSETTARQAPSQEATESVASGPSAPRSGSKLARVIELLRRNRGATIDELIDATGWLAHTTRAALTGLRKRGYEVVIDRSEDGSFYRIQTERPALERASVAHSVEEGRPNSAETRKPAQQSRSRARRAA
jgi:hypothetical protein